MSEVIGLRVGDVVIDGATAAHLHGKGRKERSVPLWRPTALLIRGWKRRLEEAGELLPGLGTGSSVILNSRDARYRRIRSATPRRCISWRRHHRDRLWLGHESPATTHMYLEADLSMKERTLNRLQPVGASPGRYRPPDQLMQSFRAFELCAVRRAGNPCRVSPAGASLDELRIITWCA